MRPNGKTICAALLGLALMAISGGCTYKTEIFVYDENGVEKKVAQVMQECDGIASYEVKEKYSIIIDTRYKENAGSDPIVEVLKKAAETETKK